MDNKFNTDIWRLNNDMVEVMLEVETSLNNLGVALRSADTEMMNALIDKDKAVNKRRDAIESECLRIIMRRHPFARDLRQVLAIFKLISDVERISDNIRDICEGMMANISLFSEPYQKSLDNLFQLGDNVIDSFSMTIKAFAVLDIDAADKVTASDDIIDAQYNSIKEDIASKLESGIKQVKPYISLVGAVKHYEKIGDHCVNIVEWVRYIVTGERKGTKLKI